MQKTSPLPLLMSKVSEFVFFFFFRVMVGFWVEVSVGVRFGVEVRVRHGVRFEVRYIFSLYALIPFLNH